MSSFLKKTELDTMTNSGSKEQNKKDELENYEEVILPEKFSFKEALPSSKVVVTIYGEKGSGKTMTALGFDGKKAILCFDNKAQTIKYHFFRDDDQIFVYDAVEYFSKKPDLYLESSEVTYNYVLFLLTNIRKKICPDWVIIDGLEILSNITEMVMRKHQGLKPYQGITNMGVWKERKQLLDSIHHSAIKAAKKGVIYTTYCDEDKIIEDGAIIKLKKVPKWIDTILYTTDITLHVENEISENGNKVTLKVNNSKIPTLFKTGQVIDITDKKVVDVI